MVNLIQESFLKTKPSYANIPHGKLEETRQSVQGNMRPSKADTLKGLKFDIFLHLQVRFR